MSTPAYAERELRHALALLSAAVPSEAQKWEWAAEYVDLGEFGVAFDVVLDALVEGGLPEAAKSAFEHLGRVHDALGKVDTRARGASSCRAMGGERRPILTFRVGKSILLSNQESEGV